ncbi:MAG: hypothetical protein KAT62_11385 [Desulfuromonadales bacterium]|nr:hypothetical protein [Desulfuromonadales bacterium]
MHSRSYTAEIATQLAWQITSKMRKFMVYMVLIHLLAVASPGPDFTMVLRQSLVLTQHRVRQEFTRFDHWVERVMGLVLITLGIRLTIASQS